MCDILIKNGTVITMDPCRRVLMDGAVAIEKDRVLEVGETHELTQSYSADTVIDAEKMVVMPGLMEGRETKNVDEAATLEIAQGETEAAGATAP